MSKIFQVFLDKLLTDIINLSEFESNTENIEHLLRLMLFAKLFYDDGTSLGSRMQSNFDSTMNSAK